MSQRILSLAKQLIAVESVKENPPSMQKVLDTAAKELGGFSCKKFSKNSSPSVLYYNAPTLPKKFKLILNAHLDVVPAKQTQFKPKILGDKLYGRGAMDMKSAAAVEITVFKELAKKVNYPLGLQMVTDEETGGFNGTKFQVQKGIRADFVIAGESTNLNVSNEAKGIIWLKLKFKGSNAHAAYLWNGTNSNFEMVKTLQNIWKKYPVPKNEQWRTTVNIAKLITNNETFNKVPDYSEAWMDFRYIPADNDKIIKEIKKVIPKGVEMEFVTNESVHFTPKNNKYVQRLLNTIKTSGIKNKKLISKSGGNDVRHFNEAGCAGVIFGPVGEGLHSDTEWVDIKSLRSYYEVLKNYISSLN